MLTERETIAWTGCTRARLARCPEMSIWWDVPLTSRSLTSMQSLRVVLQLRLASCPAPSSTPPLRPLTSIWLPKSEKTHCLKSGQLVCFPPCIFFWKDGESGIDKLVCYVFLFDRKREEEKKREVLTNPVKMKKIKEMVNGLMCFFFFFLIDESWRPQQVLFCLFKILTCILCALRFYLLILYQVWH